MVCYKIIVTFFLFLFFLQRYVDCTVLGAGSMPDAEDSSYDSDYEAEDATTTTTATTRRPRADASQVTSATHSDVSRTASDTLAAEFAEYVTIQGPSPTQNPGKSFQAALDQITIRTEKIRR